MAGSLSGKDSDRVRVSTDSKFTYPGGMCKKIFYMKSKRRGDKEANPMMLSRGRT